MATIKQVKAQIENANALGRQNLTEKGVEVNGTETTYQLMQMIANISGGSGTEYASIVYNDDDTITLLDKDGITHTMVCTYENGVLTSVTYDGKAIVIGYEGDKLIVGKTEVDLNGAKTSAAPRLTAEAITTFSMNTNARVDTDA